MTHGIKNISIRVAELWQYLCYCIYILLSVGCSFEQNRILWIFNPSFFQASILQTLMNITTLVVAFLQIFTMHSVRLLNTNEYRCKIFILYFRIYQYCNATHQDPWLKDHNLYDFGILVMTHFNNTHSLPTILRILKIAFS